MDAQSLQVAEESEQVMGVRVRVRVCRHSRGSG